MRRMILALFGTVLLVGCGSPVYQECDFLNGGYKSIALSENEFIVGAKKGFLNGDGYTPIDLDRMVMLRAADLTIKNGYTHFTFKNMLEGIQIHCYHEGEAPKEAVAAKAVLSASK